MHRIIQKLTLLTLLAIPTALHAQGWRMVRGGCTPLVNGGDMLPDDGNTTLDGEYASGTTTRASQTQRRLGKPNKQWDSTRVYKQLVVLISYSDTDFRRDDARGDYNKMFNEPGYNEGLGPGCLADYFREQSGGKFNVVFDVFGPYKVSSKAQPYSNPTSDTKNYGYSAIKEATNLLIAAEPGHDYAQYDWNGDGYVDQVICVVAGYAGNQASKKSFGYLWPNTASISSIRCPDGVKISNYTASAELWNGNTSCGIGTICHEYSHSLGLPDIYPMSSSSKYYSVCDEWDLMDGGNFTNWGWCPPNYTAQEKMYLGWLTPTELTEPATISGMKPVSEGGQTYIIRHTDNEYLLLENRRWSGWDACSPGQGLVITHVDFDESYWINNVVNVNDNRFRFDIVHADNLDYEQWDVVVTEREWDVWTDQTIAQHNHYLSTSPYPWQTDSTSFVNRELTDTSLPPVVMYNKNVAGSTLLNKPVTNIRMAADGTISVDFMGGDPSAVVEIDGGGETADDALYDLQGRRVAVPRQGIYIKNGKKVMIR